MTARTRARRSLLSVPTVADLPTLTDNPVLWYVGTSPPQLWLTDSDGQRELGWSAHAAGSADITLGNDDVGEANAEDITGATVTLPKPGTYIIIAVFDFQADTGIASTAVGILREADNTVVDTPRGAIFNPAATGDRVTVTQTWRFTSTTDNEVLKLSAYHSTSAHQFTVFQTHTTITASAFLGGDETASTHTHTHDSTTSRTEDDHHAAFVGLEGDGSPVVPAPDNRINIKAGANVTVTPTANDITIASTGGGGGSGPHILTDSTVHTDMKAGQDIAIGDIIVRNAASEWQRLHIGPTAGHVLSGGTIPVWRPLSFLLGFEEHGTLSGLTDDDHPQYANQTNTEVISGEWTWETYLQYSAVSAPAAPAEDHIKTYLVKDGSNLILRGIGPTGAVCDICTLANVVVAHTNILTLNLIE